MSGNKHVTLMEGETAPRLPPRKSATHTPLCDAQHTLHNHSAEERREVCVEARGLECVGREEEEGEEEEEEEEEGVCISCRRRVGGAVVSREQLQRALQEVQREIEEAQGVQQAWEQLQELPVDSLQDHVDAIRLFKEELAPVEERLDRVNVLASGAGLTEHDTHTLHNLNADWRLLQECIEERVRELQEAQSQHLLTGSVQSPWERAVSAHNVPYYINHSTHSTSWDHPRLLELFRSMADLNDIKFSAYRTAMKLRRVQKTLKLDRIPLSWVEDEVRGVVELLSGVGAVAVQEVAEVLGSLYERLRREKSVSLDVALCVDMSLNWLLGVYDSGRTGKLRPLSLLAGLVCLSDADVKDKCSYLFRQACGSDGRCDAAHLRSLLHELLLIPRRLGEDAAFGGTNVEPSVSSCLRMVSGRLFLQEAEFLSWISLEPQSLVWLPVLQRVSQSERTLHRVRCSVCRRCPILGFRYRSLKQFNVDICQSCFLSGRAWNSKSLQYPIIEYYTQSTSGEKMRDFAETLKNMFRSKEYFNRHPQRGYLPVQSSVRQEEDNSSSPKQQRSDSHSSVERFACRLVEMENQNCSFFSHCFDEECYPCRAPDPEAPPTSSLPKYGHTPTLRADPPISQPSHSHTLQDPPLYTNLLHNSHAHLPKSPSHSDSPIYINIPKYNSAHSGPPLYTNLPKHHLSTPHLAPPLYANLMKFSHAPSAPPLQTQTPPSHAHSAPPLQIPCTYPGNDGHTHLLTSHAHSAHPLQTPPPCSHAHIDTPPCSHPCNDGHTHLLTSHSSTRSDPPPHDHLTSQSHARSDLLLNLCNDDHAPPRYTRMSNHGHAHSDPPPCSHLAGCSHAHLCQRCPVHLQGNVTFLEEQSRLLQGEHQRLQWQRAELEASLHLVRGSPGSRGEKIRLEMQMHTLEQHTHCLESHLQDLRIQLLQARDDCENSVSTTSPATSCSPVPRPPRPKSPDPTGGCGLSEGRGHANDHLQQTTAQLRIE